MRTLKTIRNCHVEIRVPCPKLWENLAPTGDDGVRHCATCARDVYLCDSDAVTLEHARQGHCIAREEPHPSELPSIVVGRPRVVPDRSDEEHLREHRHQAARFRRRERGIDKIIDGRLEYASRPCPRCAYPVPVFRKTCYVCDFEVGRGES